MPIWYSRPVRNDVGCSPGDKAGQQAADAKWQQNGVASADFLSKANPHWPRATLVEMMKGHLTTTTNEVVARLNKNHVTAAAPALSAIFRFSTRHGNIQAASRLE